MSLSALKTQGFPVGNQSAGLLEGFRYQHLYSWLRILDLLDSSKALDRVWLEHPKAGSVDDLVIYSQPASKQPTRYYQVKWHKNYRIGYSAASLIEPERKGGTSLLAKFWKSWRVITRANSGQLIELWLLSNWGLAPEDPLGQLIRGRSKGLNTSFFAADPAPNIAQVKQEWQQHLQCTSEELDGFCRCLRFELGYRSIDQLEVEAFEKMRQHGLKATPDALSPVINQVKVWIENQDGEITKEKLLDTIRQLDLRDSTKRLAESAART